MKKKLLLNSVILVIFFPSFANATISGIITDSMGTPLPGIWVQAWDDRCTGSVIPGIGALTDASGNYTINNVPDSIVYIMADPANKGQTVNPLQYVNEWWDNIGPGDDCSNAVPITHTSGSVISNINFMLEQGGSISGAITNSDGDPLEGIWVQTWDNSCNGNVYFGVGGLSDSSGNYTIDGVPVGSIYVMADPVFSGQTEYYNEWWDNVVFGGDCSSATPVTVVFGVPQIDKDFSLSHLEKSPILTMIPSVLASVYQNSHTTDCNNVIGGTAYIDNCNNCVGGNTGETACTQDCNGVWGGTAVIDECGVCGGDGTSCSQCSLACSSSSFTYTCGSSSSTTTRFFCYIGSTRYIESLLVQYSNGHSVNCTSQFCGGPLTCIDDTGASCTMN